MHETYDPQEELDKFSNDLPPMEDLPGGAAMTQFPDFPLSTHDGLVAAWSYISDPANQDKHDQAAVDHYKQRIQALARQKGVDLGNV